MISPAAGFQPADPGDGAGAPPYPGALLQLGDEGEDVRTVQEQLNELGEDLEADGVFGPLTEAAVRQFQEENGLDVDGIVGPDTWTALWEPPGDSGPAPGVDGLNAVLAEFDPTGASDATASQDGLSGGVEASRTMAETDAPEVLRFTDRFEVAGAEFDVPPALLAGIASRESRGGAALDENGEGDGGAGVGIMQVDQTVRPPEEVVDPGDDFASQGHINQATEILRGFIDQAADAYPGQSAAVQLQAGVAAYNTGASAFEGGPDEIDVTTTGEDYSNDVIARAQYYAENWNVLIA